MITIKVPVQIIKKRCVCKDCKWYREDPRGYSYMNHAGWKEDAEHGKDFEDYYDWETREVQIEGFVAS